VISCPRCGGAILIEHTAPNYPKLPAPRLCLTGDTAKDNRRRTISRRAFAGSTEPLLRGTASLRRYATAATSSTTPPT